MAEPFDHVERDREHEPKVVDLSGRSFFLVVTTNHVPLITAVRIDAPEDPEYMVQVCAHGKGCEAHPVLGYYYEGVRRHQIKAQVLHLHFLIIFVSSSFFYLHCC